MAQLLYFLIDYFLSAFSKVSDPMYSLEVGKGLEDKVFLQKEHVNNNNNKNKQKKKEKKGM